MFKDIHFVLNYVQNFISEHDLLRLYQELSQNVTQVQTDTETGDLEGEIEEQKNVLFKAHSNLNLLVWTPPQKAILKHIDGYYILGKRAIGYIEDSFNRGTGSQRGIVEDINQIRAETNELNSKIQQLLTNLNLDEYKDEPKEGKALIEITFKGTSAFSSFWEASKRAEEWNFIFRAFADLTGENHEDVKIVSLNSACPDIGTWVEMGSNMADAIIKAGGAVAALKMIKDTVFKKKKLVKEEVGLGDSLKVAYEDIENTHGEKYKQKIKKVTVELRQQFDKKNKRPMGDGAIQIQMALEKMVELFKDGSKIIDPNEVRPTKSKKDSHSLISAYKENYRLERGIKGYLKVEQQKRLKARAKTMRRELGLRHYEPSMSWKKNEIQTLLEKFGLETVGTKSALIKRYNEFKKQPQKQIQKTKEEKDSVKESIERNETLKPTVKQTP